MAEAASYQIEKGVPITPLRELRHKYPFATMEVGDSFALANSDIREIERVRASASYFGIRHPPKKFGVRRADPISKAYRCWRIA